MKRILVIALTTVSYQSMFNSGTKNALDQIIGQYRKDGYLVDTLSSYIKPESERSQFVEEKDMTRSYAKFITQFLNKFNDYDIINIHTTQFSPSMIENLMKLTNSKIIVTYHMCPVTLSYSYGIPKLIPRLKDAGFSDYDILNRVKLAFTNVSNRFTHSGLKSAFSHHLVKVISYLVRNPLPNKVLDLNCTSGKDIDLIYVGRLERSRHLKDIVVPLMKSMSGKRMIIGGVSTSEPEYSDSVLEDMKDRDENFHYRGFTPHEDVLEYIARSKFMIVASDSETFSYVTFEALKLGCKVIVVGTPALLTLKEELDRKVKNVILDGTIRGNASKKVNYVKGIIENSQIMTISEMNEVSEFVNSYRIGSVIQDYYRLFKDGTIL